MITNNHLTKRSITIIMSIIILSSLSLTSCNGDILNKELDLSQEKIIRSELSNKEENLLRATTNRYLIFDIPKLNNEYKRIDIWVDRYENGEFKGKQLSMESSVESKDNTLNRLLLATQALNNSDFEEKWTLAAIVDSGTASGSSIINMPKGDGISFGWLSIESVEIVEEETINLGAILIQVKDEDENSSMIMPSNLLDDEAIFNEHISEYDYAYILRCSFSKESL